MVLPVKYLPDVRRAHRDHLAFLDTISDVLFIYNWIGDLFKSNRMVFAVIKGVNPQLREPISSPCSITRPPLTLTKIAKLSDSMFQESTFAFDREIGFAPGESGTFNTVDLMTAIVLRTMVRIIAGKELSRSEGFLDCTKAYLRGIFFNGFVMLNMPVSGSLRDFLAWPLNKYHQRFRQQRVINMIMRVAAKRLEMKESWPRDDSEFDVIQCSLDRLEEFPFDEHADRTPLQTLSHEILHLIWAAGQSPAMVATTFIFKLLEEPSYIAPLREESQEAFKQHGSTDAVLKNLPKLDSFIREVNRLYPSFSRKFLSLVHKAQHSNNVESMRPGWSRIGHSPSLTGSRYPLAPASPFLRRCPKEIQI